MSIFRNTILISIVLIVIGLCLQAQIDVDGKKLKKRTKVDAEFLKEYVSKVDQISQDSLEKRISALEDLFENKKVKKNLLLQMAIYEQMGKYYSEANNWREAEPKYKAALDIASTEDKLKGKEIANIMAVNATRMRNYSNAIHYYEQEVKLANELGILVDRVAPFINISKQHQRLKQYREAKRFARTAIKISEQQTEAGSNVRAWVHLAILHQEINEIDSAKLAYDGAVRHLSKIKDPYDLNYFYRSISSYYNITNQNDIALVYADSSLVSQQLLKDNVEAFIATYSNLAQCQIDGSMMEEARQTAYKVEGRIEGTSEMGLKQGFYKVMINYAKQTNDVELLKKYEKALEDLGGDLAEQVEVNRVLELERKLSRSEKKLALQEQQNEIECLRADAERDEMIITIQKYVNIAGLLFSLLLASISFSIYRSYKQKKEYNQLLEYQVEDRTNKLNQVNAALEQSNNELRQFNYIISHDLQEPIRNIVSFSNLAQQETPPNTDLDKYINFIAKGGKQLHNLVTDVMEFSQFGNDQDALKKEEVRLVEIVEEVKASLYPLIHQKKAEITYTDLPNLHSYPSILFIVFKNLISNGLKYNESQPPKIHIDYQKDDLYYHFTVTDNGIGIKPSYHNQIFQMFKRLHNKSKYEGTGLGLAITQKILRKINGNIILVSSNVGEGSTFQVSLPIEVEAVKLA